MVKYTLTVATRGLYRGGGGVFIRKIILSLLSSGSIEKIFLLSDEMIRDTDLAQHLRNKIIHLPVVTIKGGFLFNYPYFFIKSLFLIRKNHLEKESNFILANNSIGIISRKKISILHNSQLLLSLGYCKKLFTNPLYNIFGILFHGIYTFFDFFDIFSSCMTYCVGKDTFSTYKYFHRKKISGINNFLLLDKDKSKIDLKIKNNKKMVIFMASRLEPLKGLADTCVILSKNKNYIEKSIGKEIEILVAGSGSEAKMIKRIEGINFLGQLSENDIKIHLEQSDLFILPSYHDNFPTVLLESLFYGNLVLVRESSGEGKYLLKNSEQLFSYLEELPEKIIHFGSFAEKVKDNIITKNRYLVKTYVHQNIKGDLSSIFQQLGGKKI